MLIYVDKNGDFCMKIKITSVSLIFLTIIIFFNGCTTKIYPLEEIIKLPSLSGEYQELKNSFSNYINCEYEPCFPDNGNYQYSFILHDMNGDNLDDAIVFYYDSDNKDLVKFVYLLRSSEKWSPVSKIEGKGSSVDKVMFVDVNRDGRDEMIVGWSGNMMSKTKSFNCYSFANSNVIQYNSYPYSYLDYFDIDNDGSDEIFSLSSDYLNGENNVGYARIYRFAEKTSTLDVVSEARVDGNVSAFLSVSMNKRSDGNVLYVESLKFDNNTLTDVLYWDDDSQSIISAFFDKSMNSTAISLRPCVVYSFDLNNDGVPDVPSYYKDTICINSETEDKSLSTVLKWLDFDRKSTKTVQYTLYNIAYNYLFKLPSSWVDRLYITDSSGQIDFYFLNSYISKPDKLLFSICTYDSDDSNLKEKYSAYQQLSNKDSVNYAYFITDCGSDYGFDDDFIKNNFILKDFR